ncbi:unnamed protein product [Heligmosomoides polygyrus]|uniref:Phlebovirus_G2 domain-containing protein n=1 Tax=Heligmosomoides polygyrus TaxID=6339 RepID=A0A3P8ABK9_HELPZ|nr:unnamed protein product [Heligmosomoides polygyrus]
MLNVYRKKEMTVEQHGMDPRNPTGGKLDKKDLQFIQKRRIRMSLPAESRLCSPTVLIGCDQLWNFIKFEAPQLSPPFGLVPTRFGYMISGRRFQRGEQRTDSRNSSVNEYAVPKDDEVYEIFRCITWKEIVKLRLDITDVRSKKLRSYVLSAHPNVPQHVHNMDVTVSLISVPPLPVLKQFFISSQNRTAIWDRQQEPILRCQSEKEAEMLQCVMGSDCDCTAAESQVICRCKDDPVESSFHNISNVLPMNYQQVRFTNHPHYGIVAKVNQDISAEVILNMKDIIDDSVIEVTDEICTLDSTHLKGCITATKEHLQK